MDRRKTEEKVLTPRHHVDIIRPDTCRQASNQRRELGTKGIASLQRVSMKRRVEPEPAAMGN
jgi:hypothetical protein